MSEERTKLDSRDLFSVKLTRSEVLSAMGEHRDEEGYWNAQADRVKSTHPRASEKFRKRALRHRARAREIGKALTENEKGQTPR
jgi:hypothetical protein